jgi:hypothetical protein
MADLIANLGAVQQYLGWSDDDMARECGISRRMWQYAKAGTSRLGTAPLAAIARRFPGARDDVFDYMGLPPAAQHAPAEEDLARA